MKHSIPNTKGFTLVELLMALGIFSIIILGVASILIISLRSNSVIWEQLSKQNEGRKVLQEVVDDLRRAEVSSVGSYPLAEVQDNELIFYANVDDDADRERIRFWLDSEIMYKGVIDPSGAAQEYVTSTESIKTLATDVKNVEEGVPVFSYFDSAFTGTSTALTDPINITEIRMVQVQIELEKDPTKTPVPLHVESMVMIRNLKEN